MMWCQCRIIFVSLLAATLAAADRVTPAKNDLHSEGVAEFKAHDYHSAITHLQAAASAEEPGTPVYKESMLMIGQSYFMLSQAPAAIPYLEKVAGVTDADYMLGYAYVQNRQPDQAEAAFARLFHQDAHSPAGHLLAGQMLLKGGYESDAKAELLKALQASPSLPQVNYLLAEIAIFQGGLPEAAKYLSAELSVDPNYSMAWYRLGDVYSRQGEWASAVPHLQRAIWLNPDFSGPYILLGKCYLKQENYSNAEGILRKGLKLDPNNASGTYLLGQTLMAEGKTDEARTVMEKVKALHAQ